MEQIKRKGYESAFGPATNLRGSPGTGSKTVQDDKAEAGTQALNYGKGPRIQPNQISVCDDVLDAGCWAERGEWALVDSSNVAAIAYNQGAKELYVEFIGEPLNSIYVYRDVQESVAKEMFNASSQGRFVWQRLRDKYPYSKIK